MPPAPFNLLHERWIPVALANGQRAFVRPCDISELHEGQAILRVATGRPDCDISLTEFLIGLLAVTFPPESNRDWVKRHRTPPKRMELEQAFAILELAMRLDGEGPRFFQDIDPFEQTTPINKLKRTEQLFVDGPGDNAIEENADHFVKRATIGTLSRAGAAIALVTIQTMSPAGGPGKLTSVRGGGPLTTLVVPSLANGDSTLWNLLWANVPADYRVGSDDIIRVFPWLTATRQGAKGGIKTTPDDVHVAQVFFGLPRRLRLIFHSNSEGRCCDVLNLHDDIVVQAFADRAKGTDYDAWDRRHPLSPYYKPKKNEPQFIPVHLQSSRVGYQNYLGMILKNDKNDGLPARCVADFYTRAQEFDGDEKRAAMNSRLLAAGYAMDNMKPLDFGEALMPLIVTGDPQCDGQVHVFAEEFVKAADLVANQLTNAIKRGLFGENAKADRDSTVLDAVRQRFWADTERDFYAALRAAARTLIDHKDDLGERVSVLRQANGQPWLVAIRRAALAIFDDTVPIEDAESSKIKDVIEARKMLLFALTGFGPVGAQVFGALGLPAVETKAKKGRKAA